MKLSTICTLTIATFVASAAPALAHTAVPHEPVGLVHGLAYPLSDAAHAAAWLAGVGLAALSLIGAAVVVRRFCTQSRR